VSILEQTAWVILDFAIIYFRTRNDLWPLAFLDGFRLPPARQRAEL